MFAVQPLMVSSAAYAAKLAKIPPVVTRAATTARLRGSFAATV